MLTLGDIATTVGAQLYGGNTATPIGGVATLQQAGPQQISFLSNPRYRKFLATTRAGAVILSQQDASDCPVPVLLCDQPHVTYAHVARLFVTPRSKPCGIHPTAHVSSLAQVADSAWVGPHCTLEAEVVVGPRVFIGPNCVIGRGAVLGADTFLVAHVTICHEVRVGERALIHPGAVLGSDGFGLANDHGHWIKVPQLGGLQLGDDVEIGANTTIDRGALDDTIIEQGVKLDNQIQVAHNVHIGAHTVLAGCVGIAGSVSIGHHCMLGGGVGVAGHLHIADHVRITGMSLVTKSISEPGSYSSGLRAEKNQLWNKISARLRQLDDLARRLMVLEKKNQSQRDDP